MFFNLDLQAKSEINKIDLKNNVKVYEPKSSDEKWSGSLDLISVTLGEDPLQSPSQRKNVCEAIDVLKDEKNTKAGRRMNFHKF